MNYFVTLRAYNLKHIRLMGMSEIAFILFVVVMFFGSDKLPEIARMMGKGMRQLKDATNEIKSEIQKSAESSGIDTSFTNEFSKENLTRNFTAEIDKIKEDVTDVAGDITGPIKRNM